MTSNLVIAHLNEAAEMRAKQEITDMMEEEYCAKRPKWEQLTPGVLVGRFQGGHNQYLTVTTADHTDVFLFQSKHKLKG